MDVRCPQCQTLYELDDEQVGARSVTLKCSQCQHVFRLSGRAATVSEENQRRWMVRRKVEGDILYLNTFDTLHEWIMKREVRDEDEISRTGARWAALGEIGEFQPMFQVVESIAQLGADNVEPTDTSSILTMRQDTPTAVEGVSGEPKRRERIRTSIQYGGAGTPPESKAQMRAEDITKKVGPTDVMPDEVAAELEDHFASEAEDEANESDEDLRPTTRQEPMRPTLATADISRERRDEDKPQKQSSGVAPWLLVGAIGIVTAGGYAWLSQQEDLLKKEPDVVVIGATNNGKPRVKKPTPDIDTAVNTAVDAALSAAAQENDAIWTMWHETASKPFYVALDIAYAEADTASVGVELEQELRNARIALENGRAQQASRQYRTVLAKDPNNAGAVAGLGWALLELGSSKQAAEQFRRAIDIDASEGDAYIGLGTAHRQLGQLKEAYDAYDRYLGRFPKGAKASIASYQMKQLKKQLGM